MKGFEFLCEHPVVCWFLFMVAPTVFWKLFLPIASVVCEVGMSWGMGAFCVPAVGGWVLVFSIAVIAPHEHSTHEHPNLWGVKRRGFKGCISRCSTG